MTNIELYEKSADKYDEIQNKRPDYTGALKIFVEMTTKYIGPMSKVDVVDFCSGTGHNTKLIADKLGSINQALLIDINKEFLEIAKSSGIKAKSLSFLQSDILKAKFEYKSDAVLSMFAYHHVPDEDKSLYLNQVKSALKNGGLVFLAEIYSPDSKTTIKYYKNLVEAIPKELQTEGLKNFLNQTALSDNFEYKVSKDFADKQFKDSGFECLESVKIWPKDNLLGESVGTYVEVWKLK